MDRSYANIIESFNMYIWNAFDFEESCILFGESLGTHIWNKYLEICRNNTTGGAPSALFFTLDKDTVETLVNRAIERYNGRTRIS